MIDLRSDTVTRPTAAMRQAIAAAEVGDDLFRDDPTVLQLEETVANLLDKEDAIYVPTGTMSNQIALRAHTEPGDVVLASQNAHILVHELGAAAGVSGIHIEQLPSTNGTFTPQAVRDALPDAGGLPGWLFQPVTLVAAENTHNGAGGTVWDPEQLAAVAQAAADVGLGSHLDGARIWNAAAADGPSEAELAAGFDTVSVCFSKGLGAPIGSALAGSAGMIERARRFKQMFGGGFRQAGMMAAGALYAVEHHRGRLVEDHANAARLAGGLAETRGVEVDLETVQTNMVYFDLADVTVAEFIERCAAEGVTIIGAGPGRIRVVCHLGVSRDNVDSALAVIRRAARP